MEVSSRASGGAESSSAGTDNSATQVTTMLDLLLTIGYMDGALHHFEQNFVYQYIESVLLVIEQSAAPEERASLRTAWEQYFQDLHTRLDTEISVLAEEVAPVGPDNYVPTPLRVRALACFGSLTPHDQKTALELIHALIHADGVVAPAEHIIYEELTSFFATKPGVGAEEPTIRVQPVVASSAVTPASTTLVVAPAIQAPLLELSHPLLDPIEQTYSPHPVERKSQIDWDYQLIQHAVAAWQRQRAEGNGRLAGLNFVDQIPPGSRFLDGYVNVLRPSQPTELVVLGDLHGCYSCLKAALLQSNFIQRVWAHQWDPQRYPDVKLVLLGDYIDRGLFSFDGVLRAALHLFVSMPEHVVLLRGNHEYLRYENGYLISGVYPAEALASIAPHVPPEMLEAYRLLFEHMPTSFICDRTMFVHAGIPRDDTFATKYQDLSSFNDFEIRFQMMWSDPAHSQHIPVDLQKQTPRFQFGANQFRSFMERTGLKTLVRGHEKINEGFDVCYALGDHHLISLFSSGGHDNRDLPEDSSYRTVTPMAMTMQFGNGAPTATPWPLQYQMFNYPPHNGLYRPHPVLEFRYVQP